MCVQTEPDTGFITLRGLHEGRISAREEFFVMFSDFIISLGDNGLVVKSLLEQGDREGDNQAFIIPRDSSSYTFSIVLPCGERVNKR